MIQDKMAQNQAQQLRTGLILFLQQLHVQDLAICEKISENLLKRFEPYLTELSYEKNLKILCNQAQLQFNQALANFLAIDDHDRLTAARAKLLNEGQSTDFLFQMHAPANNGFYQLEMIPTTPASSPLEMLPKTVEFLFTPHETQRKASS